MKKQTLAFVDHSFHMKTRSGDFLRKIFKEKYNINDFWIDRNLNFDKEIFDYDNIFFFQILPPLKVLNKLKFKNLMWAPMYDSPHYPIGFSPLLWRIIEHYNIKIISFSKKLSKQISKYKINFLDLKYFIKPIKNKNRSINKLNIFFWYRGDIDYNDWSNILLKDNIRKIIYFDTLSKNRSSRFKYNKLIKYIHKPFAKKKYFKKLIMQSDIFVCPRKKEGIGMANVEALAYGKYLVSNYDSTMSEYIINNKVGIFFNKRNEKKINIESVSKFNLYRYKYVLKGYKEFQKNKNKIVKLFEKKQQTNNNSKFYFYLLLLFKFYTLKRKLFVFSKKSF